MDKKPDIGPLIISVSGIQLSQQDCDQICHPLCSGVILFARNYQHREQMIELAAQVKAIKKHLLLFVDQEGGLVQRFKSNGFDELPAICLLDHYYEQAQDMAAAKNFAWALGYKMAYEIRSVGVDVSFAPVLDVPQQPTVLLDNRVFSRDIERTIDFARAYIQGMHDAGMPATGKHFPGHGGVSEDSHHCLPTDTRNYAQVIDNAAPFMALMSQLPAVMSAHVRFSAADSYPATFSPFWLQQVLREQMGFKGAVFSDDLSMLGAVGQGSIVERTRKALLAGCDYGLVCNDPLAVDELIDHLETPIDTGASQRRQAFYELARIKPLEEEHYHRACTLVEQFEYHLTQSNQHVIH